MSSLGDIHLSTNTATARSRFVFGSNHGLYPCFSVHAEVIACLYQASIDQNVTGIICSMNVGYRGLGPLSKRWGLGGHPVWLAGRSLTQFTCSANVPPQKVLWISQSSGRV